jgi:hypothetical protein
MRKDVDISSIEEWFRKYIVGVSSPRRTSLALSAFGLILDSADNISETDYRCITGRSYLDLSPRTGTFSIYVQRVKRNLTFRTEDIIETIQDFLNGKEIRVCIKK